MTKTIIKQGAYRRASINTSHRWIEDTPESIAQFLETYRYSGGAIVFTPDYRHYDPAHDMINGYGVYVERPDDTPLLISVYTTQDGAERAAARIESR